VATVTPEQFAEREPGVRLCLFEVLWSVERELTHIFGRVREGRVELRFTPSLPLDREADCVRLASEVIEAAFDGQRPVATFGSIPKEPGWRTLMSQEIFNVIAQEVAPWRLQQGR
jgi:hypothetical protein